MDLFIDPMRAVLFAAAHLLGGSIGAAIVAVSTLLRIVLLPLTVRLARRAMARARVLASLRPELKALGQRYRKDPEALQRHTMALYRKAGFQPVDTTGALGGFIQLPVLGGIYGALKSMGPLGSLAWIANLARPDVALTLVAAGLAGVGAWFGAQGIAQSSRGLWASAAFATLISVVMFWHASAGLVLSWGSSSAVTLVQNAVLARRRPGRETA